MAKKIYRSKINKLKSKLTPEEQKEINELLEKKNAELVEYFEAVNIPLFDLKTFMDAREYQLVIKCLSYKNKNKNAN